MEMDYEIFDNESNEIKLGSKVTDGVKNFGVERINGKLSISIDKQITPLFKLRSSKLSRSKVVLKDYTLVK